MVQVTASVPKKDFYLAATVHGFRQGETVTLTTSDRRTLTGELGEVSVKRQSSPSGFVQQLCLPIEIVTGNPIGIESTTVTIVGDQSRAQGTAVTVPKFNTQPIRTGELQAMYEEAVRLIAEASKLKNDAFVKKWFGKEAAKRPNEIAEVHRKCSDLHQGVGQLISVRFECVTGEYLGAVDPKLARLQQTNCRIKLGEGFAWQRYSWGERVCTIVHELTHWVIKTVDFGTNSPTANPYYGALCLKLADDPAKWNGAMNNADNFAYYICEYRGRAADANQWKYFSEAELLSRGAIDLASKTPVGGLY